MPTGRRCAMTVAPSVAITQLNRHLKRASPNYKGFWQLRPPKLGPNHRHMIVVDSYRSRTLCVGVTKILLLLKPQTSQLKPKTRRTFLKLDVSQCEAPTNS